MAQLSASERAKLPDSAFAHIDSRGRRLLPINDESHVRNALARFEQVAFEDEAARERARKRLLNAAKRYGIVPVGFIDSQLRSARRRAATPGLPLPTGRVTFLLTDIEGSTALLTRLGDRYARLLADVRSVVRSAVRTADGREVDARADEYLAVFKRPWGALEAAVAVQRTLGIRTWPGNVVCRVRAGIHLGRPTLTDHGYVGLAVNTAARVCFAGHGGQILVSGETRSLLQDSLPAGIALRSLGRHRLQGLTRMHSLFQVEAEGILRDFPPLRTGARAPAD